MPRTMIAAAALAALFASAIGIAPAAAATLQTYDAVRAGLRAVWDDLPLTARDVTLTTGPAGGYGLYTPRDGRAYRPGEPIYVYFELLGYGLAAGPDRVQHGTVSVDLELLDSKANVLASRQDVTQFKIESRIAPLETFLSLSGQLGAFPPGEYTLRYRLHDAVSGKDGTVTVAVTLLGDAGSSGAAPASDASSAPAVREIPAATSN